MTYGRTISSLFILAAACGDDGSTTQTSANPPTSAPTTNNPPTSDTDADSTAAATDTTESTPTTGTAPVEGAPEFLSFGTNVATLTQDESVTFNAILTDPDGVADIVGGTLRSADESLEFGVFVAAGQPGAYSISLSWAQIHQTEPIEFDGGESPRGFRAVFFDQGGNKATDELTLDLVCAGGAACDGTCTDLAADGLNCGTCGSACDAGEDACEAGDCLPSWSQCINYTDGLNTCSAACESFGEACVDNGCGDGVTAVFYDELSFCEDDVGGDYVLIACGKVQEWAPGATAIRCCCTDTK
ncbi:hypothetical protein [Nannocystis sp. SCPEA4]|uniref:hypothetical protein n=1 Tax=Nannocystis sp. SCPEA4 TaxID=2996787 RepID=UPI002270B30B|nr:hypothetical protein [Nannocystis sp. SCPEA4]MCY1053576.1 hypothetical protein [Nannocystis sp. SCPEA4]